MGRRLVVDGQILQTPAWHRGMGKYSLELLAQLSQDRQKTPWDTIDVILSARLPLDSKVLSELNRKTTGANIVKLSLLPNEYGITGPVKHNRQVVDEYLTTLGKGEAMDYLILALMQQEIYPVFPTVRGIKKLLLFYDLIPLTRPDVYLNGPVAEADYLTKFRELLKADKYLAISKTAANDLETLVGIDKSRVTSIDGGPIKHAGDGLPIEAPEPFILMPTGNDARKNNERAVQAFSLFNEKQANRYSLVITSFFEAAEIARFESLSKNLVFTGNITGGQLDGLYEAAEGLLFPSEYEGLGLPILEAVNKNKPVACSNIPVFREISETAFHYFDPHSLTGIVEALSEMISRPTPDPKAYARIRKAYSWGATVERLVAAVTDTATDNKPRGKIAIFGPNPSTDNPAAKDVLLGHAELSRQCDVDYYYPARDSDQPVAQLNFLPYIAPTKIISPGFEFDALAYDEVFYSIGDGPAFTGALFTALAVPGVARLYDLRLDTTWSSLAKQGFISESRLSLEQRLQQDYGEDGTNLLVSLLTQQKAVLVVSEAAKKALAVTLNKLGSKTKAHVVKPGSYKESAQAIVEVMGSRSG